MNLFPIPLDVPTSPYDALNDVTLVIIARDELINPAGGIPNTLKRNSLGFNNILAVDTGSRDGTGRFLDQLVTSPEWKDRLTVEHIKFQNMAQVRNDATSLVKTKYALMINADEYLAKGTAEALANKLKKINGGTLLTALFSVYDVFAESGTCANQIQEAWQGGFKKRLYLSDCALFKQPEYPPNSYGAAKTINHPGKEYFTIEELKSLAGPIGNGFWQNELVVLHFKSDGDRNKLPYIWTFDSELSEDYCPSKHINFASNRMPNAKLLSKYGINLKNTIADLEGCGFPIHDSFKEHSGYMNK